MRKITGGIWRRAMPRNAPKNPRFKALIDTNVALDLLQQREPFVYDALQIFALSEAGQLKLYLSTDAISTIYYVVAKNADAATGREAVSKLLDFVSLAALDERAVLNGLALDFADVEDALVAAVAEKESAQAIITRNARDFTGSPVPVMTPREFLAFWQARDSRG